MYTDTADPGRHTPRRPVLRPGLRAYRRDDSHLQVGIDEPRVVLPDSVGIRALLDALEQGDGLGSLTPDAGLAFARLLSAGVVVDRDAVVAATRGERTGAAAAVFAAHGPEAPARLAARAAYRARVVAPEPWRTVAGERLATAGVSLATPTARATSTLVITAGEPARSQVDTLVRDDLPHLVVTLLADRARLGPFVVPGATACLRCVDAHLSESDPRRPLVLEQVETTTAATPCDPLLAQAALALAVRELVLHAEGDRPATWSATLMLSADLGEPPHPWPRHPHCGCSWG